MTPDQEFAILNRDAFDCSVITLPSPKNWQSKNKTAEEIKHISDRAHTLNAGLALPYAQKIEHAKKVIRHAMEKGVKMALSYSGGKDSTVLSHLLVFGMGIKDIPHVFSNTRMEYPETLAQVSKWFSLLRAEGVECATVFPEVRPKDLWPKIGVPLWSKVLALKYRRFIASGTKPRGVTPDMFAQFQKAADLGLKITEECCTHLKKKPLKSWERERRIKIAMTGVRPAESRTRRMVWIMRGALYKSAGSWVANPLAYWTTEDIFRYMSENGITIETTPGARGGSGCVTCMFGCSFPGENNMQVLSRTNPKMHKAALDDWGYRPVLDALGIPY